MNKDIEIVVSYHKPSKVFQSDALKPMQLGKATAKIDLGFRGDDTGDNISHKNKYYGEYTAFYWLWKNSRADVKGFMHYRRLLDLASVDGKDKVIALEDIESPEQVVLDLGLNNKNISKIMENADVIIKNAENINGFGGNIEEQYKAYHTPEYLDYAMAIIKQDFPDIYPAAKRILAGNIGWFKNLVIMKAQLFDALCEFKFGVLEKLEEKVDVNRPEIASGWRYTTRYAAFIGERLTMFFVEYLREQGVKIAEFPVVNIVPRGTDIEDEKNFTTDAYIEDSMKEIIEPIFGTDAVSVMMAVNNKYAPYCSVMLQSIIDNASPVNKYDIIIVSNNISDKNKKLLELMARPNISIRVIDINRYISDMDMGVFYTREWFSIETYYRIFIPKLFEKYKKVLYLDCDMVANRDIAELYATDIGDNWWGVTRENVVSVLCFINNTFWNKTFLPYLENVLQMDCAFDYFQSGVMIWNIKKTIEDDVINKCLARIKEIEKPLCVDQCIMNSVANGKNIFWVPQNWNAPWDASFHWLDGKGHPAYDTVMRLLENPFIMHFCSEIKPWTDPCLTNAHLFWQYARKTPFYEIILEILRKNKTEEEGKYKKRLKIAKFRIKKYNILRVLTLGAVKSFKRKKKKYRDEINQIEKMYE